MWIRKRRRNRERLICKGRRWLSLHVNFKPETDQAWQDLAEKYTDETGVQITVVTAADGQYKTTLKSELAKKEAPTIFNIGSTSDCAEYDKYIYDLKGQRDLQAPYR